MANPGRGLDALTGRVERRSRQVPPPPNRPVPAAAKAPLNPSAEPEPAGAEERATTTSPTAPRPKRSQPARGTNAPAPIAAREARYRLTIDVRAEVEGQLADCLHFIRRATGRTATRVEVIELLLAEHLPSEPGPALDDFIGRLEEFRRTSPRR